MKRGTDRTKRPPAPPGSPQPHGPHKPHGPRGPRRPRWLRAPQWLQGVGPATLRADLLAGLLGAVLVLPQAVAFATLAGLPAQYGVYTAVVPCIVAALFGSSRHVVSGPTNANSLALFAALSPLAAAGSPEYVALVLAVTLLVGALQLAVGALRLGALANFVSPSVLLGFMSGAATLIAVFALKDLLGLQLPAGTSAPGVLRALADALLRAPHELNLAALAVGGVTLAATLLARRTAPRLPFMLLGLLAGYAAAGALQGIERFADARTLAVVGPIPSAIPPLSIPRIDWQRLPELVTIAAALTIVALGQSISIAKAVAARSGQRIDANREFIGQGLSNLAGGFFSSYVSCGSLNRSMPNLEAGAETPLAAVFSALWLVALVAVSASMVARIPLAAVAGLLLLVAWGLLDIARIRRLARLSRTEFAIAAATFVATLTIRLEIAVLCGTVLSLVVYLYRTARPQVRPLVPDAQSPQRRFTPLDEIGRPVAECPQLKLVRMEGSVYFGAVAHVEDRLHAFRTRSPGQKHLLVMVKSMNFVDLAGAELWEAEMNERRAMGGDLHFHRPRRQVLRTWRQTGFLDRLGADHVHATKREAIAAIYAKLDPQVCARCEAQLFEECVRRRAAHPVPVGVDSDTARRAAGQVPGGAPATPCAPTRPAAAAAAARTVPSRAGCPGAGTPGSGRC